MKIQQIYIQINLMQNSSISFVSMAQNIKTKNSLQISFNSQFLDANFQLIKQCLIRMNQLELKIAQQHSHHELFRKQLNQRFNFIQKDVAVNTNKLSEHQLIIKDLKQNIGQDLTRRLEQLDQKSRGVHDIDKLVKQIQLLNKFVSQDCFSEFQQKTKEEIKSVNNFKNQLTNYVQNDELNQFRKQTDLELSQINSNVGRVREQSKSLQSKINSVDQKATKASFDVIQSNNMMKQINFNQLQTKIKKIKQQTDIKLNQMVLKLKKKVGSSQLSDLEKNMVQKLNEFLLTNQKIKADRDETKQALLFLQKRINDIYQMFGASQEGQDNDPMFATKKWTCASCTKDLGKFQGKLGQFKPWSVFPCRQLDPQKTGGYGYLNYVDKMAYKKGFTVDDAGLDRLNKTFFQKNTSRENSPKKMNSTRTTNFMTNYGTADKNLTSLKDQYYRNGTADKNSKFFRVKKQIKKDLLTNDPQKQRAKQI